VARESEGDDPASGPRGNGTSGRVVHEPGGWPRLAAVLAVVGLVVGGLVWALVDDGSPAGDEEPGSEPSAPPDDPHAETRREFAEAMLRFGDAPAVRAGHRARTAGDGLHGVRAKRRAAGDGVGSLRAPEKGGGPTHE
jgi:hypothetical protein